MTETIKLNLIPDTKELPVLHCSQFDDGRIMYVDLFEGEQPFILAEGSVVKVNIRKLDNNVISNVCTYETIEVEEESFSRVTVTATEQMTACYGRSYGELQISVNDTVIGTLNFYLDVERDPMQGGIDSASEIDNLTGQIEDIVEEVIGDDYYNKSQVDDLLDGKADTSDLDNYYTKSQADTLLSGKADASALNNYYTKTQADNLLSGKANASDLDNYYTKSQADTLLSGKANTSDLDNYYTKTEVDQKFLDIMPVKSVAKSPIASFYTSIGNYPIVDMKCYIKPMQSGSGDPAPDNIRPITGVSSVNVTRTGKNLLPMPITSGSYSNQVTITVNDDKSFYISKPSGSGWTTIPLATMMLKKGTYTLIEDDDLSGNCAINVYLAGTTTSLGNTRYAKRYVFTVAEDTKVDINYSRSAAANNVLTKLMLFVGNTATASDYSPYQGNTYTIALGDTYYGATLDVTRGKLRVINAGVNLSTLSWTQTSNRSRTGSLTALINKPTSASVTTGSICEQYKEVASNATLTSGQFVVDINGNLIFFRDADASTPEGLLVYPIATPIEIDLTPTQINSLLGSNNIWHDGNGDIELKFKETIQDWLDQM